MKDKRKDNTQVTTSSQGTENKKCKLNRASNKDLVIPQNTRTLNELFAIQRQNIIEGHDPHKGDYQDTPG
eukprot:15775722-Heterocapsa_arctica.AAC.1